MMKFLFNDGSGDAKEVQSLEELNELIKKSSNKENVKVWIFNTNKWMNYVEFIDFLKKQKIGPEQKNEQDKIIVQNLIKQQRKTTRWLIPVTIILIVTVIVGFLFKMLNGMWEKTTAIEIYADRPLNSPKIDIDSLIQLIEFNENRKLDRITKTNLRIRNNWPDKIVLKLDTERLKKAHKAEPLYKYVHPELTIENYSGYILDEAIVKLQIWKNNTMIESDTFHLSSINYTAPVTKKLQNTYKGDSLSLNFYSLRSKDLHFCYSYEKQSNSGNMNDKWFCRN